MTGEINQGEEDRMLTSSNALWQMHSTSNFLLSNARNEKPGELFVVVVVVTL